MNESEIIYKALEQETSATAADLANKTGMPVMKVSAALHHLKSSGKAFHIGEQSISASRQVNLYSTRPKQAERTNVVSQTWLSPLMQ